jgi:hypothetical protein
MIISRAWPQVLDFFGTLPVIEPSPGQRSSDAGLLPVRPFGQRIGLSRAFVEALDDPRDPDLTEHTFLEMVRARVYGILALGRRDGPAFRDRIVGAEAAGQEVARGGLFDRSNQVKIPSARRSD